jgi:hypothetical protein
MVPPTIAPTGVDEDVEGVGVGVDEDVGGVDVGDEDEVGVVVVVGEVVMI